MHELHTTYSKSIPSSSKLENPFAETLLKINRCIMSVYIYSPVLEIPGKNRNLFIYSVILNLPLLCGNFKMTRISTVKFLQCLYLGYVFEEK